MVLPRETIRTGAPDTCPTCQQRLVLDVHRSAGGYYVGTYCKCGPYSRESGYYRDEAQARQALRTGVFGR